MNLKLNDEFFIANGNAKDFGAANIYLELLNCNKNKDAII
jgi:hypothetical protein